MTAVVPEIIDHLDFVPACEEPHCRSGEDPRPPAPHRSVYRPPCGCRTDLLVCTPCAEMIKRWVNKSSTCTRGHGPVVRFGDVVALTRLP